MALLSTTTLREDYLADVSSADSDTTTRLARGLQRAEDLVARHLGYPGTAPTWASTSYTLRLSARRANPRRLLLPVAPVTAIASVYQDLDLAFGASTQITSTQYELEALHNGAYLHILPTATELGAWYQQERSIKVTCTAGYANEAAVPDELAHAVYSWVADWWLGRRSRTLDSSSQGGSTQQRRELAAIPADLADILGPYVLLGAAGLS